MGTRLYVSNLPLSATEAGLSSQFCKFGIVLSIALDAVARTNRRGAFVEMQTRADAHRAIAGLNLSNIDGCLVSVYLALAAPSIP